ncbi:nuclear transport factor 2 family protein [Dysgonomonas sp. GY617]|uniref:nuclear transport factor 2 family protein n=1 Tax=Dysgonomonas sp. GY617 TaxID=2780420 RepID=UPI0018837633|nr:nuclear transport factor 2 family protein [Dysgonomonas sp. GY617]MBF0577055.1 nuclear transport factor 2 family protein [Dysgonomonas sp. GY617]
METINKSTEETRKIVESFYNKTTLGDVAGIIDLMSDGIEWEIPGNESLAPWVGLKKGKSGVNEFYTLLNKNTKNLIFKVDELFINDQHAVALGYVSTIILKTNKIFNSYFMAHFTVSDKRITKYLFLEDSFELAKALTIDNYEEYTKGNSSENIDIIKKYFKHVSTRNMDTINSLFAPDIEVYFPQSGVLKSINNLLKLNKSLIESIDKISYDYNNFVYTISGNRIIVEGIESGTYANSNNSFVNKRFCSVFEIKNGLICRMYVYANLNL